MAVEVQLYCKHMNDREVLLLMMSAFSSQKDSLKNVHQSIAVD